MLETLGPEGRLSPIWIGLAIGLPFGALAEASRFCLRRAFTGMPSEQREALSLWLLAMAAATAGTQGLIALDLLTTPSLPSAAPLIALVAGGVLFGLGVNMARGCPSRLLVLSAGGNMRALLTLLVAAITVTAMTQGVLEPISTLTQGYRIQTPHLHQLPYAALALPVLLAALALLRRPERRSLILGPLLGLLIPLTWAIGQRLTFIPPIAEALTWVQYATRPSFGLGLIAGAILGAGISTQVGGRRDWQSFTSAPETLRHILGALLLGIGGVLLGGCTVAIGLGDVSTLSTSAWVALGIIAVTIKLSSFAMKD